MNNLEIIGPTIAIRNSNRAGMILANKLGCKSSKLPSTQRWLSDCEIAGELKLEGNGLSVASCGSKNQHVVVERRL